MDPNPVVGKQGKAQLDSSCGSRPTRPTSHEDYSPGLFLWDDPIIKGSKSFEKEREGKNRATDSPFEEECEIVKYNPVHNGKGRDGTEPLKSYSSSPAPSSSLWAESTLMRGFLAKGVQAVMGFLPRGGKGCDYTSNSS